MTTRRDKPAVPLCEDDNPEILLKVEIYFTPVLRIRFSWNNNILVSRILIRKT